MFQPREEQTAQSFCTFILPIHNFYNNIIFFFFLAPHPPTAHILHHQGTSTSAVARTDELAGNIRELNAQMDEIENSWADRHSAALEEQAQNVRAGEGGGPEDAPIDIHIRRHNTITICVHSLRIDT